MSLKSEKRGGKKIEENFELRNLEPKLRDSAESYDAAFENALSTIDTGFVFGFAATTFGLVDFDTDKLRLIEPPVIRTRSITGRLIGRN